jgi:hypothetical protein
VQVLAEIASRQRESIDYAHAPVDDRAPRGLSSVLFRPAGSMGGAPSLCSPRHANGRSVILDDVLSGSIDRRRRNSPGVAQHASALEERG